MGAPKFGIKIALVGYLVLLAQRSEALDTRGGSISSNSGELEWECDEGNSNEAVFVITAGDASCGSLVMTVHAMSPEAHLHIYDDPYLDQDDTCGRVTNHSGCVDQQININGSTVALILNQPQCDPNHKRFSCSWTCTGEISSSSVPDENGAFVAAGSGLLTWSALDSKQRHTTAIIANEEVCLQVNSDFGPGSTPNGCDSSSLVVHEIQVGGCLRKLYKICGKKTEFKMNNVSSNLLAIAKFDPSLALSSSNSYEIEWNEDECPGECDVVTPPPCEGESTTTSKPNPSDVVINRECGGIVDIPTCGASGQIIYKNGTDYDPNERCIWVVRSPSKYIDVTFPQQNFEAFYDGIIIGQLKKSDQSFKCNKLIGDTYSTSQRYESPVVIQFSSDSSVSRSGFVIDLIPASGNCNQNDIVDTFYSNAMTGSFHYPPTGGTYANQARALAVIQAGAGGYVTKTVGYDLIDLDAGDCTKAIEMGAYTELSPCTDWKKICGYHANGAFNANLTANSVISTIHTDSHGTASGMSIHWSSVMNNNIADDTMPVKLPVDTIVDADKGSR